MSNVNNVNAKAVVFQRYCIPNYLLQTDHSQLLTNLGEARSSMGMVGSRIRLKRVADDEDDEDAGNGTAKDRGGRRPRTGVAAETEADRLAKTSIEQRPLCKLPYYGTTDLIIRGLMCAIVDEIIRIISASI